MLSVTLSVTKTSFIMLFCLSLLNIFCTHGYKLLCTCYVIYVCSYIRRQGALEIFFTLFIVLLNYCFFFFSVLSRVKVKFVNSKIRIEHVPKNGERGIALEIHIEK